MAKKAKAKAKVKKKENMGLLPHQVKYIINKIVELGDFDEVCRFYNTKDTVSAFAKQTAANQYGIDIDDLDDVVVTKKRKGKLATTSRKRKIDMNEVTKEEY